MKQKFCVCLLALCLLSGCSNNQSDVAPPPLGSSAMQSQATIATTPTCSLWTAESLEIDEDTYDNSFFDTTDDIDEVEVDEESRVGIYDTINNITTYYDGYAYYGNGSIFRMSLYTGEKEKLVGGQCLYDVHFVLNDKIYFSDTYDPKPYDLLRCNLDGSDIEVIVGEEGFGDFYLDENNEIYGSLGYVKSEPIMEPDGYISTKKTWSQQFVRINQLTGGREVQFTFDDNYVYYLCGVYNGKVYYEKYKLLELTYEVGSWFGRNEKEYIGLFESDLSGRNERRINITYDRVGTAVIDDELCILYQRDYGLFKYTLDGVTTELLNTANYFSMASGDVYICNNKIYVTIKGFLYEVYPGKMEYIGNNETGQYRITFLNTDDNELYCLDAYDHNFYIIRS